MGDDAGTPAKALDSSVLEAAEVRAWRVDKARRLPRRARLWAVRMVMLCVGGLVLLGILGGVVTFATGTLVHSMTANAPRQK